MIETILLVVVILILSIFVGLYASLRISDQKLQGSYKADHQASSIQAESSVSQLAAFNQQIQSENIIGQNLKSQLNLANSTVITEENKLLTANAQMADLQSQLQLANSKLSFLQTQLTVASAQVDADKTQASSLQDQLIAANNKIASIQSQMTDASAPVLQAQLASSNTTISTLQAKINQFMTTGFYKSSGSGVWVPDQFACNGAANRNTTGGDSAGYANYCIFNAEQDARNQCTIDPLCKGYVSDGAGKYQLTRVGTVPNANTASSYTRKNAAYPSAYGCVQVPSVNNNFLPSRATSSNTIECLSYDKSNCLWSPTLDSCQSAISASAGKQTKNISVNVNPFKAGWPLDVFNALG